MSNTSPDQAEQLKQRIIESPKAFSLKAKQCLIWAIDQSDNLSKEVIVAFGDNQPRTLGAETSISGHDMEVDLNTEEQNMWLCCGCSKTFDGWYIGFTPKRRFPGVAQDTQVIKPDHDAINAIKLPTNTVPPRNDNPYQELDIL